MNPEEIQDLLSKMDALVTDEDQSICALNMTALMKDPIVPNRLGVELLQRLPPNYKFDGIVTPAGDGSYFAYATAMAAWARFIVAEKDASWKLHEGHQVNDKEKIIVMSDKPWNPETDELIEFVESRGGKVVGVLLPFLTDEEPMKNYPVCGLW